MTDEDTMKGWKYAIVVALTGIALLLTLYAHLVLHTGYVFTHFFYVPIILAVYWFEYRGMAVPVLLALALIATAACCMETGTVVDDIIRSCVFTTVAFAIASLRTAASKAELALKERTLELEKANARLKELDELKSMFIASMSHELRTPLNSIIGFTGIVLQGLAGKLNAEQRKQLLMVNNSSKQLLALINDVIDVSQIEAGKTKFDIRPFDLSDAVRETAELMRVAVAEKGLTLAVNAPKTLIITSDERRVKQIALNFLSNAVKFTDKGNVKLTLKKQGGKAMVSMRDTGIGIRKEDMPLLFSAFGRVGEKGATVREGTGLGLYLSRTLARRLGGEISMESEFGKGSVFTLVLPLKRTKGTKVVG